MDINGKKVIITGGARGLGRAYALELKSLGAEPYVVNLHQEHIDALKKEAGIPGTVVNVSEAKDVEDFVEKYVRDYGVPDILINNAGVAADALLIKKKGEEITKFPLENWEKVIKVNLTGTFIFTREVAYYMVKYGVKGLIINISSITRAGNIGQTNYSATKAGIIAMTITWMKELSKYGIRVAAVAPGYVNTEMCAVIKPELREKLISQVPAGRLAALHEIAQAVKFIIQNDFFNGRVIEVDGGMRL